MPGSYDSEDTNTCMTKAHKFPFQSIINIIEEKRAAQRELEISKNY